MQRRCFIDMDGVLADFVTSALLVHGLDPAATLERWPAGEYAIETVVGVSLTCFWQRIDEQPEFWHQLKPTPEIFDVLRLAEDVFGPEHCAILTSPSNSPRSHYGKAYWIQRYLPDWCRRLIIGSAKHMCASPYAVLIDDCDTNIKAFNLAGGNGILFPRPWNSLHGVNPLRHVRRQLEMISAICG